MVKVKNNGKNKWLKKEWVYYKMGVMVLVL